MSPLEYFVVGIGSFLATHTALSYTVLFLGAYFETLIGVGFFIYGEFFFLPGAIIAGTGVLDIWLVSLAVISGGILGDTSSYFIGRFYGMKLFKEEHKYLNHTNHKKGEEFFNRYGVKSVFFARLLGPISWIAPFLAGVYKIKYAKFLAYNIPGVVVGIGEFLVVGYFFGTSYREVLRFVQKEIATIAFSAILVLTTYYVIKRNNPNFIDGARAAIKKFLGKK
jgi:membrane-associated protein